MLHTHTALYREINTALVPDRIFQTLKDHFMFKCGISGIINNLSTQLSCYLISAALTDHLIFVCRPLEHVSRPLDVEQDVGKDSNGILVASHHQVGKTHIVISGDLALGHTGVHTLTDRKQNTQVSSLSSLGVLGHVPLHIRRCT